MSLNQELVRTRCQQIEDSLQRLGELAKLPVADFLKDRDAQDIACYRLLVAIEAALGLCYHVASRQLKKVPEDYAECFSILGQAGVIASDLSGRLQEMARFRNLLVHVYWQVDLNRVHRMMQDDLGDLRDFSKAVAVLV